ncbi:hypothetical protein [Spirosoma agri]|uniref:DUF4890 domain-containing protein n=1 Tax=Spirosoma agri TaxID=1987381 RepID=A0A6M0IDN3_9BACT|nr:hypothetical protein [Spirosoma agri]NEU65917.1 hypothetical protein [Spirosoma agri]
MNTRRVIVALVALFLSIGAYAQDQTAAPKGKPRLTIEERKAKQAAMKAKLAQMSPEERSTFRKAHHERMQTQLKAMTPEQRATFVERRRHHKAHEGK